MPPRRITQTATTNQIAEEILAEADAVDAQEAKAETARGNAARLGGASTLCLGNTPGQDGLAALLLLVRGGDRVADRRRTRFDR